MEHFGYTQATDALTGKTIKGFFVVASRSDESREVIRKHPFLTGCMTTETIIMANILEFEDNQACQIGSVIVTEFGKSRSLEFNLGCKKLVINDRDPRAALTVENGKIRFLAENESGEVKAGILDANDFTATGLPKNIPANLLDVDSLPDIERLAACYPELSARILPKQIFTKPLDEEYSF